MEKDTHISGRMAERDTHTEDYEEILSENTPECEACETERLSSRRSRRDNKIG